MTTMKRGNVNGFMFLLFPYSIVTGRYPDLDAASEEFVITLHRISDVDLESRMASSTFTVQK